MRRPQKRPEREATASIPQACYQAAAQHQRKERCQAGGQDEQEQKKWRDVDPREDQNRAWNRQRQKSDYTSGSLRQNASGHPRLATEVFAGQVPADKIPAHDPRKKAAREEPDRVQSEECPLRCRQTDSVQQFLPLQSRNDQQENVADERERKKTPVRAEN